MEELILWATICLKLTALTIVFAVIKGIFHYWHAHNAASTLTRELMESMKKADNAS